MNILVTGAGGPSGINTIRLLKHRKDIKITAVDMSKYSTGLSLAYESYLLPPARSENFIESILSLCKNKSIELVIPTVDEELLKISNDIKLFDCKVVVSPNKTIKICNDKAETIKALKHTCKVPETLHPKEDSEIVEFIKRYGKSILKPKIGRGGSDQFILSDKIDVDYSVQKLRKKDINFDDIIIQEHIDGSEFTVDALNDFNGNFIGCIPRERIKVESGVSVVGKCMHIPQLEKLMKSISDSIVIKGPWNAQFKENEGEFFLLEINPRFSGGLNIVYAAGVNLPLLLIKLVEGKVIEKIELDFKEILVGKFGMEVGLDESISNWGPSR